MMQAHETPMDSEDIPTNLSANPHFQSVVDRAVSRRGFLRSGTGLSAAMFLGLGGGLAGCAATGKPSASQPLMGFQGIAASTADELRVAPGYSARVLAPWGTPLLDGAPAFKGDGSENAAAQALQVGDNHDGLHFLPWMARTTKACWWSTTNTARWTRKVVPTLGCLAMKARRRASSGRPSMCANL